jgi:TnpA family transposase
LVQRSALAEVVNAQFHQPFAACWGEGTTSSSDGVNTFETTARFSILPETLTASSFAILRENRFNT